MSSLKYLEEHNAKVFRSGIDAPPSDVFRCWENDAQTDVLLLKDPPVFLYVMGCNLYFSYSSQFLLCMRYKICKACVVPANPYTVKASKHTVLKKGL